MALALWIFVLLPFFTIAVSSLLNFFSECRFPFPGSAGLFGLIPITCFFKDKWTFLVTIYILHWPWWKCSAPTLRKDSLSSFYTSLSLRRVVLILMCSKARSAGSGNPSLGAQPLTLGSHIWDVEVDRTGGGWGVSIW